MYKYFTMLIAMFLFQLLKANASSAFIYALNKNENGIQGSLELVAVMGASEAKVRILDEDKNEVESRQIPGKRAKLEFIKNAWQNGPLFLVTTDQRAEFGSYSGYMTRPFQVRNGHLDMARISKGPNAGRQIVLMQSLKNEWKMNRVSSVSTNLDAYEVSCFPNFDRSTDDEAKFDLTYTRYHFDGSHWEAQAKTKEGCWETGDKFPNRSDFL